MDFEFRYSGPKEDFPLWMLEGVVKNIDNQFKELLINQLKIMALIDDLKAQVTGLQTQVTDLQLTVDAEQAQITALLETNAGVVTNLNNQITSLQQQIANGATEDQLQDVIDSLTNVTNTLATTKTDIENTVDPGSQAANG